MTIEFNCPKCGAVIAFDDKHAGRQAKCLTCGQKFIIPAESFQKPKKVKPEPEPIAEPIPGFYKAVFLDSWKVFVRWENVTTLTFVVAIVCFKFFLARGACCMNHVAAFVVWGWLLGFYMNVICQTAIEDDRLPDIYLGEALGVVWLMLRPFLIFFVTLFLVELPLIIALALSGGNVPLQDLWNDFGGLPLHLRVLAMLGLFVFPAAILTNATGKDFTLLRPDYLLRPVVRAFVPYVVTVALLVGMCVLQWHTTQYTGSNLTTTAWHLAINLAVQVVAIVAMRSVGLFYRHYSGYFKW